MAVVALNENLILCFDCLFVTTVFVSLVVVEIVIVQQGDRPNYEWRNHSGKDGEKQGRLL